MSVPAIALTSPTQYTAGHWLMVLVVVLVLTTAFAFLNREHIGIWIRNRRAAAGHRYAPPPGRHRIELPHAVSVPTLLARNAMRAAVRSEAQ